MNTMQTSPSLRSSKGFTLLEMFLVVVIMAAIGFVAARHYSGVSASNKAHEVVLEVNQIHAAAALYNQDRKTPATSVAELVSGGYLANDYQKTPWGSDMILGPVSAGSYTITVPEIPSSALCFMIYNRLKATVNTEAGQSVTTGGGAGEVSSAVCTQVVATYPLL